VGAGDSGGKTHAQKSAQKQREAKTGQRENEPQQGLGPNPKSETETGLDSSVDLDSGPRTHVEIEEIAEKTEWDRIQKQRKMRRRTRQ
jgi:hypothetical protein